MHINHPDYIDELWRPPEKWEKVSDIYSPASEEAFYRRGEVHVWQAPLKIDPVFFNCLSTDEKTAAEKFIKLRDQYQYKTAHSILRIILAAYRKGEDNLLQFVRNKYGKPYLIPQKRNPAVAFNMTYAEEKIFCIVALGRQVGIDTEYADQDFEWSSIAELYFSEKEKLYLKSLPDNRKNQAFFWIWTRKEALLKASGTGVGRIEDLMKEDGPSFLQQFSCHAFAAENGYLGTLAVQGKTPALRFLSFPAYRYK